MKKYSLLSTLVCGLLFTFLVGDIPAMNTPVYMKVHMEKTSFHYPDPVIIQVYIYGPNPIAGAGVYATITSPSGKKNTVLFSEDAVIGNMIPKSGGYAGVLTELEEDGIYRIRIHADDNRRKAHHAGGFIQDLPNPVPANQQPVMTPTEPFAFDEETAVQVSGYAGRGGSAPMKISTLYAEVDRHQCVHLSWITPLNIGPDGQYEIRCSSRNITSEKAWKEARKILQTKYTSKGGEVQKQKICSMVKGSVGFAVRSSGKKGLQSEISNNYRVLIHGTSTK